jgi:diacylglycerol kinase family enzyme
MMKRGRIAVKIDRGMFASERSVSFEGVGKTYHLMVDESDVQDGKLEVGILDEAQDTFLVALPTDTFTTGSTVRVPREVVEVA